MTTAAPRTLTRTTIATYAIGSLGTGGFAALPGLVLVYYLTDTLGIAALAAGILVTIAKVWDVLIDPVIGARSDRSLAHRGTRRPVMLLGAILLPILFVLTFAVPAGIGPVASSIWVFVAFVAAATAFSMFQVPYIALPAELTSGYDQRTKLLATRVVVLTIAILLFGAGAPEIRDAFADERLGYLVMALSAAALIGVSLIISSFVAPTGTVASAPTVSIAATYRAGLAALKRSQPFRALLLTFLLQGLATGVMLAGAQYVATWVLGAGVAILFVSLIGPALVFAPVWAAISRRIGKERAFVWASALYGVAALLIVLQLWWPGAWIYAPVALAGAGYAGMQALPMSMLPDVISHDSRRHKIASAGTFGGVWTAGETTGMALGATVLTIVLATSGYRESVANQMVAQPDSAIAGIIISFSIVPAVIIAVSLLTFARYPLRRHDIEHTDTDLAISDQENFDHEPADILERLAGLRRADAPTHGGRVLSYVYDSGLAELDELAASAIRAVQPVNGLDPTTFTSVAVMEREVVAFARDLLGGDADVVGTVTTGGTESCLLAVKTARDVWRGTGPSARTGTPRLLAPVTVHAAFQKAAHYFGLELDVVPVGLDGVVAAKDLIARFDDDVALVVVSAPSYAHAAMDPVVEVAAAAAEHGIACHVDACIGGWVLPFWEGVEPWNFEVTGVTSISADLHKFGYAPKGVSVLLQRDRDRQRAQYFATTRWPGYPVVNPTILGSKSAGPLAAAWAIIQALGTNGLAELAQSCARSTRAVRDVVDGIEGLRIVGDPVGPLVAVASDESVAADRRVDTHHWADQARQHGFLLQLQPSLVQSDGSVLPATTHLTVTPVTANVLDELSAALTAAADEVRGVAPVAVEALLAALPAEALAALGNPDAGPLDSTTAAALLGSLGLGAATEGLPERMAPLLTLIAAMPAPLTECLLIELLARLIEPEA